MLPAHSGSVSRSPPGTQWALVPGTAFTLSSAGPSAVGNHGPWRGRLPGVTHHESPQKHKEPPKRDPELVLESKLGVGGGMESGPTTELGQGLKRLERKSSGG